MSSQLNQLIVCPTNVKEALEWLEGLEDAGGATHCANVITQKILGSTVGNLSGVCKNVCKKAKAFLQAIKKNGNGGVSYTSSTYQGAQWTDLCQTGTGGTSCCASTGGNGCEGCKASSGGGSCDGCCYDCPQIKCARIFCLIVPIVYYFLEYLSDKCQGEWERQQVNGNGDTDLKNFLLACGFNISDFRTYTGQRMNEQISGVVNAIKNVKEELKKAFKDTNSKQPSLDTTTHNAATREPTTIREMMLWLQGLPYCPQFHELKRTMKEKCDKLKGGNGVSCDNVMNTLVDNICLLPGIFLSIEGTSFHLLKDLMDGCFSTQPTQCFLYKQDGELFKKFCEYTYKVHTQLRFLLTMCDTDRSNGGWEYCTYANGSCNCSTTVKTSCLKLFLQNGNNGASGSGDNKFKLMNGKGGEENRMGFKPHEPQNGNIIGRDIQDFLEPLIDDISTTATQSSSPSPSTSKPLSLLTQYCVAIGQLHPSSLGDLFAFFAHLGTKWSDLKLHGQSGTTFKDKLKEELKKYPIGNFGGQDSCDELQKKIKAILSSHTSHSDDKSLMSLMCSSGGSSSNSCAPYMKSLSSGLYHYYLPDVQHEENKFNLLQYLYDMLRKLLDGMKQLQKEFNECDCCKNGSKCDGLISCQYAHPILYKFGFVFGEPSKLKKDNGPKKCDTLKAQLKVVLSCKQGSESALFSAFECVIQVTYKVLLERAKGCVTKKYDKTNGSGDKPAGDLKSTNQEMNDAFTLYVTNAMYDSYPKLICTFACKVFKDGQCNGQNCKKFHDAIKEPTPRIAGSNSNNITVTSSAVTSISAVIPSYTAPPIDQYHYRVFQKKGDTQAGASATGTSTSYTFRDAIDFHVSGAQCIRPTPVALRSVIDWILRVTTGAIATQDGKDDGKNSNDNIKQLSEAIKSVLEGSGVTVTGDAEAVQQYVTALVEGLRKFMGYQERSRDVISKVGEALGTNDTNGIKKTLKDKIDAIDKYLKQKDQFASELGKALLKGRYEVQSNSVIGALFDAADLVLKVLDVVVTGDVKRGRTFAEVITTLQSCLTHIHTCQTGLKCTDFQPKNSADSQSTASNGPTVQNDGLQILKDFFQKLNTFAALWDSIGQHNGNGILQKQKNAAAATVSNTIKPNGAPGSPSANGQYFTKLYEALKALGQCAQKVQALNGGNGSENSSDYRTKITALITGLKAFGTHIAGCNFSGSEETGKNNNASDPVYAVKGAEALIKKTVSNVESEITKKIKGGVEKAYAVACGWDNDNLKIGNCSAFVKKDIAQKIDHYKSHLDDLKQLCQWLYRMGQLYAHGLKGFVESLVKHLQYIHLCISRTEYLIVLWEKMNGKNIYGSDLNTFNLYIAELLDSYILKDADSSLVISDDKASEYRGFLSDLRLLALDRYTLQVWQDECNPKDSRPSAIKDWITFENGIVRHSDLEEIKTKLSDLTMITKAGDRDRIHDFHAICVIQKFSYEAPIARLERSLEKLNKIQGQLSEVKQKCDTLNGTQLQNDPVITTFCDSVSKFLQEPYGIFSFAKFVHTILGPNAFSAVIAALEELKNKDQYNKNNGNGNLDRIKGILKILTEGLEGENNTKDDHYKLDEIIKKLEAFISTLKREYIFSYPVVTANKASQAIAAQASPPNPQPKNPTCPNRDHSMSSICKQCYHYLARIFIGSIPNLYRHCRLLYEMCDIGPGYWYNDILSMGYEDYYNRYMLSLSGFMSHQGYEVLTRGKDIPSSSSMFMILPRLSIGHPYCIDGITTHYTVYRAIL